MVFVLTSLFVGLLSMLLVEESFSCAQFSFGGGCLLPCSHTVNLAWTMFLVHATWYSKLLNFLCVEWTICTQQKSLIVSSIPEILAIQRKAKEFGTLQKAGTPNWPVHNSSQVLWKFKLIGVSSKWLLAKCVQHAQVLLDLKGITSKFGCWPPACKWSY